MSRSSAGRGCKCAEPHVQGGCGAPAGAASNVQHHHRRGESRFSRVKGCSNPAGLRCPITCGPCTRVWLHKHGLLWRWPPLRTLHPRGELHAHRAHFRLAKYASCSGLFSPWRPLCAWFGVRGSVRMPMQNAGIVGCVLGTGEERCTILSDLGCVGVVRLRKDDHGRAALDRDWKAQRSCRLRVMEATLHTQLQATPHPRYGLDESPVLYHQRRVQMRHDHKCGLQHQEDILVILLPGVCCSIERGKGAILGSLKAKPLEAHKRVQCCSVSAWIAQSRCEKLASQESKQVEHRWAVARHAVSSRPPSTCNLHRDAPQISAWYHQQTAYTARTALRCCTVSAQQ